MKQFEHFRAARQQVYEGLFSAKILYITGLIIMPALLFNSATLLRIPQFLFFWFLAWLSGKKNNPLVTILVILGIVAFNLTIPYGRVLFSVGVFRITSGALMAGIHRAVTLEGLIMLSRVTIRRDLKFPGLFGELVGESFRIFAIIMDRRQRVTRKNFIADIDRLMLDLSCDETEACGGPAAPGTAAVNPAAAGSAAAAPRPRTKPAGFFILAVVVILSWLPWAVFLLRQ